MTKFQVNDYSPETLAINAGLDLDPYTQDVSPNITMSVNHQFSPDSGTFSANGCEDLTQSPFLYAGWTNPTVRQLEKRVATLEHCDDGYATASGMAAISAVFLSLLKSGDHLIIADVCYAATNELALQILPSFGIQVTAVNLSKLQEVKAAIQPNTRLVFAETPCNPLLRLTDLKALATLLQADNIVLAVDSTFATPVVTRPADFGADLIIHSLTKFMNGHGDALGGCVVGGKALVETIRAKAGVYLGAAISAQSAWLIMRGIETLYPRMNMMCHSALQIATWLEAHPKVSQVNYPGLSSHPQYSLAQQQMQLPGSIIVFQVDNMEQIASRLSTESKIFYYAFSIGQQRSLAVLLQTDDLMSSTYRLTQEQKEEYLNYAGKGLIRLSIGLESADDLIADLSKILR